MVVVVPSQPRRPKPGLVSVGMARNLVLVILPGYGSGGAEHCHLLPGTWIIGLGGLQFKPMSSLFFPGLLLSEGVGTLFETP